jgi:hypothetical protein
LKTLSLGEKKWKNPDEAQEKGEKPEGYLPTLEAEVK